jgi:phage tail-like protein
MSSRYLAHLPATLQQDPFLGALLQAFERILTGSGPDHAPDQPDTLPDGSAQIEIRAGFDLLLSSIEKLFEPAFGEKIRAGDPLNRALRGTPEEFLPWLAGWVATSLRDDWDPEIRRGFISAIPKLYRIRGTPECIRQMLAIYLNGGSTTEDRARVTVTEPSTTVAHYFRVEFTVEGDPTLLAQHDRIARAIIDQEKPAHTFYGMVIRYKALEIHNDGDDLGPDGRPIHEPFTRGVWVGKNTVMGSGTV